MKKFFQTACAAVVIMMCAVFTANAQKVADEFRLDLRLVNVAKSGNSSNMTPIKNTTLSIAGVADGVPLYCSGRITNSSSAGIAVKAPSVEFFAVNVFSIDGNSIVIINSNLYGVDHYATFSYPKEKLIPTQEKLTALRNSETSVWEPAKIIKSATGGIKIQSILKGSSLSLMLSKEQLEKIRTAGPDWVRETFTKNGFPFRN